MIQWKRVVDRVIWGLYLAAILLCAYVTAYAVAVGSETYAWLGGVGWVVSTAWGLFFRVYVMDTRGKRRKPKGGTMPRREGRGFEIKWHPSWGWHEAPFRSSRDVWRKR